MQREKIQGAGIAEYFEAIAISGDLGISKPNPQIFEHLLGHMGLEPGETLMVGNGMRTDIGGANAAGMPAIFVERGDPHTGPTDGVVPDATIRDLTELESVIHKLAS